MSEVPNKSTDERLDPSRLMDNAACASQCRELLDDHPTRQAVLLNVYRPLWDEIQRLREILTIPNITPETTSPALFIRTLTEHEKGQPVNTQDLINALMWRVRNQRRELARLQNEVPEQRL